ncbi:AB hydrolase superfamily protein FGSG_00044 [Callorhinchus milii]|uniref:AB hydrolase superfamily protein FGSG_00044 n=1 Tax=Callorhinchus milii TaxID=7868 RepID=UPI001C3FC7BA|nr:AB hydrolase superfamily protein FGSG_00044 [Callorhinchus milii]
MRGAVRRRQPPAPQPRAQIKNANEVLPSEVRPASVPESSFCSRFLSVAKYFLLVFVIPPFLNYASLQREGTLLQPQEGKLVDIGLGQSLYLNCQGKGQPVVVCDAPAGMSSDVWLLIQKDISQLVQVCIYDRAGLGFSKKMFQNETTGLEKMWRESTTGRMVDDLHRLVKEAKIESPFIFVGSELGALNARFYAHIHDWEISELVLIDPFPEDLFVENVWLDYWYKDLVSYLQTLQFSAAAGLNRMFLITGMMQQPVTGENISVELAQRQKYLLSNPAHLSAAVDEHFFINESVSQVRDISKFKPLSSRTTVTVITGDHHDEQLPVSLNKVVAQFQQQFIEQTYPSAKWIKIKGMDRRMIYRNPSEVAKHLKKLINRNKPRKESQ